MLRVLRIRSVMMTDDRSVSGALLPPGYSGMGGLEILTSVLSQRQSSKGL